MAQFRTTSNIIPANTNNLPLENNKIYQINLATKNITKERTDKNKPNRYRTIIDIMNYCYSDTDFAEIYNNITHKNYYYPHEKCKVNGELKLLLKTLKYTSINEIIELLNVFKKMKIFDGVSSVSKVKVLDIGCGNCDIGYKLDKDIKYCGIDVDPYILTDKFKPQDNIYKFNLDFNNYGINNETVIHMNLHGFDKYHLIICNNSLHYAFHSVKQFFKNINGCSYVGSYIYVFGMFTNKETTINYADDFYVKIKQNSNTNSINAQHIITYKYPWLNNNSSHGIYSVEYVKEQFAKNKWIMKDIRKLYVAPELMQYRDFFDLHKIMIFKRI